MDVSDEKRQAIGNILHSIAINAPNLPTQALGQIIEQLRCGPGPGTSATTMPVSTNDKLEGHDGQASIVNPQRKETDAGKTVEGTKKDRGKLRPLNAFICFRSYYGSVFAGLTQKIKSGLIRQLWANDNWKHFWSIEAKAYSDIRDAHLEQISLEKFLAETVGLLGLIPAENYLHVMGWMLIVNELTEYQLVRVNPGKALEDTPLSTNLSAADIVAHCYDNNLVQRPSQQRRNAPTAGVTMAFGANPNHPKIPIVVEESSTSGAVADEHASLGGMTATEVNANVGQGNVVAGSAESEANAHDVASYGENLSIEAATADLQRAMDDYPDEYPYNHHFHPEVEQPILAFDPSLIQHDFDPFDIGDFVNFDV